LRKYFSIFLLLILLFNIIGYRAWFYYAEIKADARLETRLDENRYEENEHIAITIPLDNPYQMEQRGLERISGEITLDGKTYKYVKRRVMEGNLIIYCIPDTHKMILKKAGSDYGNAVNDLAGNNKSSSRSGFQKNFSGNDYENHSYQYKLMLPAVSLPAFFPRFQVSLSEPQIASSGKPPQFQA